MPRTALTRAPLVLLVTVLAGVLVAGLALPAVGAVGLAARMGTDTFESLPQELSTPPLAQRSRLLAADGTVIATLFEENRVVVPLDRVPQVARDAVLSIEDSRFYEHNGLDLRGLARAFVANQRAGRVEQGGSTLTQQYVKNVLLNAAETDEQRAAATEQSNGRKLREARLALAVESELDKEQILERYLNIAYFGGGAYGIGTAAQRYYGKAVEDLTLNEAATLAGLLQSPSAYDPLRSPERARERRDIVLRRMAELGTAAPADVEAALAGDLGLAPTEQANGCANSPYPFFCDYVLREQVPSDPAFGATPEERITRLLTGGLTVRTTLDPQAQAAADEAIARGDRGRRAGATVMVAPGSGDVVALATSETYGEDTEAGQTTFPLATTLPGFQAGSTFKAFAAVAALERGMSPSQTYDSPGRYESDVCDNPGSGFYRNYGSSNAGRIDMRRAMARSTNTYFVQLTERLGASTVAQTAKRLGVRSLDADGVGDRSCSIVLGGWNTSILELTNAYATIASGGVHCQPRVVLEAVDAQGSALPVTPPQCERVLDERVAAVTTDLLRGVVTSGTGTGASLGRPAAGKTGTTNNNTDVWFVGYTPQLASGVWLGFPERPQDTGLTGGSLPATIWGQQMRAALRGTDVESFPPVPRARTQTRASGSGD